MAGLLLIIFAVYLLVLFIQSVTREHVSIYEVTEKQIADDEVIRGIILRDETLVKSKEAGYINYYVGEGARIGVNTKVYSIDSTGKFFEEITKLDTEKISLSQDDTRQIRDDIAAYRNSFNLSDYNNVINFKYNIDNTLLRMTTINLLEQLNEVMKNNKSVSSLKFVNADKSGIISFCSDGYENLSVDNITKKNFEHMTDEWTQLRAADKISKGTPVYKRINSENWSVILPLTSEQYEKIYDKDVVSVTIKKDNLKMNANISTFTSESDYYAKLDFNKYMIRYLDNRYLDLEIEINSADGLKIPVSSILKKSFYVVPKKYITKGGDSGGNGVLLLTYDKDGTSETTFTNTDIYYETEDGNVYIDTKLFDAGSTIVEGASGKESMRLTKTATLEGVYNCNRGYCEFRRIEKLYANDEYAIVSKDTDYGLSAYDHIILNPDTIGEDDIIY